MALAAADVLVNMNLKEMRVYVAGSTGMVGRALVRELDERGYRRVVVSRSDELDLTIQQDVDLFFKQESPEVVIIAAAKVGGIVANDTYRAEFIYNNLMIEANLIHAAYKYGTKKLVFLGSSCIYPRLAPQPMKEEYLLTGPLEQTNEPYAIAKIAGIKLCESYYRQYQCDFISVMPTNLYGPHDNFDLNTSHVIPALILKFHLAKLKGSSEVVVWGSGEPLREFLYVDDLAEAVIYSLEELSAADIYENGISHINIGSGSELKISELAGLIKGVVGYEGTIRFDTSMPDGTPRKLLDISRMTEYGWQPRTSLKEGLERTYQWFLSHRQTSHFDHIH